MAKKTVQKTQPPPIEKYRHTKKPQPKMTGVLNDSFSLSTLPYVHAAHGFHFARSDFNHINTLGETR